MTSEQSFMGLLVHTQKETVKEFTPLSFMQILEK